MVARHTFKGSVLQSNSACTGTLMIVHPLRRGVPAQSLPHDLHTSTHPSDASFIQRWPVIGHCLISGASDLLRRNSIAYGPRKGASLTDQEPCTNKKGAMPRTSHLLTQQALSSLWLSVEIRRSPPTGVKTAMLGVWQSGHPKAPTTLYSVVACLWTFSAHRTVIFQPLSVEFLISPKDRKWL